MLLYPRRLAPRALSDGLQGEHVPESAGALLPGSSAQQVLVLQIHKSWHETVGVLWAGKVQSGNY